MLPNENNAIYPEFVPDQVLMSEHLNSLFRYLDEGERMTRANLIGIGVVCGLEIRVNAACTELAITKGCGVTSSGYLVAMEETKYVSYKAYDSTTQIDYDRFVDSSHQPKFHLDILKQVATEEGTTPLSQSFLDDKVVLIFVELYKKQAKNCEPESCDDKGAQVTVSFLPLLIAKEDYAKLKANNGNNIQLHSNDLFQLPEFHMRRFDVPATRLAETADIFIAYRRILDTAFLQKLEAALTQGYNTLLPFLADVLTANPFADLANDYQFLHQGTITQTQILDLQYYYDFFSDLVQAYEELRIKATEVISLCCPDEQLFPRHLFIGDAIRDEEELTLAHRQYFIPSPAIACRPNLIGALRFLFRRLVVMIDSFEPPTFFAGQAFTKRITTAFRQNADPVRITPSKYGDIPLSQKALPYYYNPELLVRTWSFEKSKAGKEYQTLSYHAPEYNATDDHVREPLRYDLEPYNFLRIEGHLGKRYTDALRDIQQKKEQYRLPFEIVVLSADTSALRAHLADQNSLFNQARVFQSPTAGLPNADQCQFQDLQALYDTLQAEAICCLGSQMKYFYGRQGSARLPAGNTPSQKPELLPRSDPSFTVVAGSLGEHFEHYYATVAAKPYMGIQAFDFIKGTTTAEIALEYYQYALLYYVEKLSELIPGTLSAFDLAGFQTRLNDLKAMAKTVTAYVAANKALANTTLTDHIDALRNGCCSLQAFQALYKDYMQRKLYVMMLHQFGYFVRLHPGIQHKAGVPVGGTFILVYHDRAVRKPQVAVPQAVGAVHDVNVATATRMASETMAASSAAAPTGTAPAGPAPAIETPANAQNIQLAPHLLTHTLQKELLAIIGNRVATTADLDRLIAAIPDGTVIADFFLPYLCYSNCAPVQYIINEQRPPEPLSIVLQPTQFCNDDQHVYPILVSSAGGSISGDGTDQDAQNGFIFTPTAVSFADGSKKRDITITYEKDGQKATTVVSVFRRLSSKIDIHAELQTQSFTTFRFTAQNASPADKFEWTFATLGKSSEAAPVFDFHTAGTYNVHLIASNGVCTQEADFNLVISAQEQPKSCMPLQDVLSAFEQLHAVDEEQFKSVQATSLYKEIAEIFTKLQSVVGDTDAQQIAFFEEISIEERLDKWIEQLDALITSERQNNVNINTALIRILALLAMHIACFPKEDVDVAKVPTASVFKILQQFLQNLSQQTALGNTKVRDELNKLLAALKRELEQLRSNGEEERKKLYKQLLEDCIKMLNDLLNP